MKEKISIIIPIYNTAPYLEKCINSIINQTYRELEIILINDGSKDKSEEICLEFCKKDKRIRYFSKENSGVSSTRNLGIMESNSKYLMFVDSDDYLSNNMVEKMLEKMFKDKSDLVCCNFYYANDKIITSHKDKFKSFCVNRVDFVKKFDIFYENGLFNQPWNKLYKKQYITEKFDNEKSLGEDLLFNISYLNNIEKISYLSECLYFYNCSNETSITKNVKHSLDEYLSLNMNIYTSIYCKNKVKIPLNMHQRFLKNYIKLQNDFIKVYNPSKKIYLKENYYKIKKIIKEQLFYSIKESFVFSKLNYYILSLLYILLK